MRASLFAPLAMAALAAAAPQVTSAISPSTSAPAGCSESYSGKFAIEIVNVTSSSKKRSNEAGATTLICTLADGILKDAKGRTGYIASNSQFQFDDPPQTGAIYTAGWSVCSNGSLAIGDDAIFYKCLSGTYYNLYDESTGAQCSEIYIDIIPETSSTVTTSGVASQLSDGQVTATAVSAVTEISDGQIQATTSTAAAVSEISDGQIQATTSTAAAVSEISDGQIQATTSTAAATTTAAAVSEISDGQIQATTSTAAAVSEISDGQIQATTSAAATTSIASGAAVSQISDGQIQASTGSNSTVTTASATSSVTSYTGAAVPVAVRGELFGLAVGVLAVAIL